MDIITLQQQIDSLKVELLNVNNLYLKIDSIKGIQTLNEINYKLNTTADIVNSVNSFYDSAWTKLIFVITFIGIIVPVVIQYFQRQNIKEIYKRYSIDFERKMNLKIEQLKTENEENFEKIKSEYNIEIKKIQEIHRTQTVETDGNTFYLQGRVRFSEKNFKYALSDFIKAANKYISVKNTEKAKVMLEFIALSIEGLKNKSDFQEALSIRNTEWNLFMGTLCTDENHKIFMDEIQKLNAAKENLK